MGGNCVKAKLSMRALGFALGVFKGVWLMGLAWMAWGFGVGIPMVEHISHFYHGYGASLMGGVIGGVWGFVCGFIIGVVFAFLYNIFLRLFCKEPSA